MKRSHTIKMMGSLVLAAVLLFGGERAVAQEHPAEKYGYGFPNPSGGLTYSWDVFRNAFYGVPIDSSTGWYTAPFDMIFYTEAIRAKMPNPDGDSVNGAGRCFGWSTSAAMMAKFGGYRGFCGPPIRYRGADPVFGNPVEPGLTRVVEIAQCQQLTLVCVQGIIDQAVGGHSMMANYIYNRAKLAIERDGTTILGVTKTIDPLTGAAHAVIGYAVVDSTPSLKKLMVVDPNRTWGIINPNHRGWYQRGENYILLDLASDNWRFRMGGANFDWPNAGSDSYDSTQAAQIAAGTTDSATVVNAHPIGEGHLIIYPLTTAGIPGRTPTSLGLGVAQLLTTFWIYNEDEGRGGRIEQLYDPEGKRLFSDPETRAIDWDGATGIGTMFPWFPMVSMPRDETLPLDLWFHRGPRPSGTIDFTTGEGNAVIIGGMSTGYFRITCDRPDAGARIRFAGIGSVEPLIIMENATEPMTVSIEMLAAVQPGTTNRVWKLENIALPANVEEAIRFSVDAYGSVAISGVSSEKAFLTYSQKSLVENRNIDEVGMVVVPSVGCSLSGKAWRAGTGTAGE